MHVSIHMSHALSGTVEALVKGHLSPAEVSVLIVALQNKPRKFQVVEAAKLAKEGRSAHCFRARIKKSKKKRQELWRIYLENLVKVNDWPC